MEVKVSKSLNVAKESFFCFNCVGSQKELKSRRASTLEEVTESTVSKAIRMFRAGDAHSDNNQKLRDAVSAAVARLLIILGPDYLPESTGLVIRHHREGNDPRTLHVRFLHDGHWHDFYTYWSGQAMHDIQLFCEAMNGPFGDNLTAWLEQKTEQREKYIAALTAYKTALL